jgi:transcription-repair coupling factor (superfamily II helicase)
VAYAAAALRRHHPDRLVMVVTPDDDGAESVCRDLRFLCASGGSLRDARVVGFPADERGPYAEQSPDAAGIMERVATLFALVSGRPPAFLVASAAAVARRTLPVHALERLTQRLVRKQDTDRDALLRGLHDRGYTGVEHVEDVGTYAVRGSIVDVFAPGERWPVRIDLFGDEVESLRPFDPETQRTLPHGDLETWSFGPAREVVLDDESVSRARSTLRDLADAQDIPTRVVGRMLEDLQAHIPFFGVEGLLPAFHPPGRPTLLGFLASLSSVGDPVLVVEDPTGCAHALRSAADLLQAQHDKARAKRRLALPPSGHHASVDQVEEAFALLSRVDLERVSLEESGRPQVELGSRPTGDLRQAIVTGLKTSVGRDGDTGAAADLLKPVVEKLKTLRAGGVVTLVVAETRGGVERLKELLDGHGLGVRPLKEFPDLFDATALSRWYDPSVHAWVVQGKPCGPARGVEIPHLGVAFIAEADIFGKRAQRTPKHRAAFKTSLSDLEPGDHVVHVDHGVAAYRGLTRMALRGVEGDFLLLEYAGGDKLYLPVTRINLVQRYVGAGEGHARLDRLGGVAWQNTKQRVRHAILAMAGDLLNLYARRELAVGHAFPPPDATFREFEAAFPFEETPDQQKAIDDCLADLRRGKPMDRLVCGDVGYGKTEVAMRASVVVAMGGKQVAVLAPTTVLAQQHYNTFTERLKAHPVRVEVVSSFRQPRELRAVLKEVKEGKVDVLVGTHRLLNPDVAFKDLGLVVVDEEHRFGVQHKERLKQLRASSHVLTLSATPIPRTLQMAFLGVRDLSLIQTPPADRRAIRTTLARFSPDAIREAVLRELKRGGQVYFVHNRVQSIGAMRDFLSRLVPEARIGVGHGQMESRALEETMLAFIKKETNLLLCTTIIESGIDIPTANTIIINRADQMGLAQLYQLRGRVGRSADRGFALLLVPPASNLTPEATRRLEALQKFTELGAGFQVAQHDLELRGAGELLGKSQHGHVAAVGYEMYAELLAQAVMEIKGKGGGVGRDDVPDPEVNLPVRAFIPESYIPDVHDRLGLYQRLASARQTSEIYDEVGAAADQNGEAPPELTALAEVMVLKQKLRDIRARSLDVGAPTAVSEKRAPTRGRDSAREGVAAASTRPLEDGMRILVTLGEGCLLDPARVLEWIGKDPDRRRLTPQMKLVYTPTPAELLAAGEDVTALCRRLLNTLVEVALGPAKSTRAGPAERPHPGR